MEDTLREIMFIFVINSINSLNPCFNGRYSQSNKVLEDGRVHKVLILVLMEDTLRDQGACRQMAELWRLNPCFNGRYSQRTKEASLLSSRMS